MDTFKMDMKHIDKKDSANIILFIKNIVELRLKNIKKTGKDLSQENYFKLSLKELNNKKINFTEKTKTYLTNFFEENIRNPVIINKMSKVYIKALKDICSRFDNIQKKNIKETKTFMEYSKKILDFLKKYKLNSLEQDSLLIDFFVSKGYTEVEIKSKFYKIIVDSLKAFLKFMPTLQKYVDKKK
jgi:hypothetical protein